MRPHRWLLALVCCSALIGFVPAHAADPEPITDKGGNVYDIDGQLGDLPNLLPGEEVDKLNAVQANQRIVNILSPISPDDEAVFAAQDDTLGFFNIQDGSFLGLDPEVVFKRFIPLPLLNPNLGWGWRDGRTLTSLGVEILDEQTGEVRPVLVFIDRTTGEVSATPISFANIPSGAIPVSTAPDGTHLIIIAPPQDSADAELRIKKTQTAWDRHDPEAALTLSAPLQAKIDALVRTPYLKAFQQTSALLNPASNEFSVFETAALMLSYDATTGDVRELRQIEAGTAPFSVSWSQDSAKIATTFIGLYDFHKTPDARDNRYPFDGALISEQIYRDVTGNLPPAQNPFFQNNTLETFDVNTGDTQVLRARDGDGALFAAAQWSSDGQAVLAQVFHPGKLVGRRYPIYFPQFAERTSFRFYNAALKETSRLEAPQVNALSTTMLFASPDEVFFRGQSGTNRYPYYYNRKTGELRRLADKPGNYGVTLPFLTTRLSRQMVFYYQSFTQPVELYRINWDGSEQTALTDLNAEIASASHTRQDAVSFKLANGQVRTGVLIQPDDAPFPPKNARVVVWQEGGPGGVMVNTWAAIVERPFALLPNANLAVLVVPLAGREGYGPQVYNALYDGSNFGQLDIDEQAQIVQQMMAKGWTSKGKVGITGCSYGGYFVTQSIVRYPDMYAAANDQCALIDHITEWSRGYAILMPYLQGLPPWKNDAEYRRDSPLYNADVIKTPLLTFKGTEDFLPITLNQNLHAQLFNRNVPSRMLNFVGAGHGLVPVRARSDGGRPITPDIAQAYEQYGAQEQLLWFRQYLK